MNKESMTVHMLLTEMKTIEKRIDKAMKAIVPIATKENASKNVKGISVDEFEERAKAGEQRVLDLINRHNAMKSTLYQYNTTKEIIVAGKKMTVAHALWLMQRGMDEKRVLLKYYETAYAKAVTEIEKTNNGSLNAAAERAADIACGSKDKADKDEYLKMVEQYKESHQLVFVDPLHLVDRINELSEEIEKFDAEVDARIQTANATTEVEIEY